MVAQVNDTAMSKTNLILSYLKEGHQITQLDATEMFGCTRLSSIIFVLKDRGHNIVTHMIDGFDRYNNPIRYASYELIDNIN